MEMGIGMRVLQNPYTIFQLKLPPGIYFARLSPSSSSSVLAVSLKPHILVRCYMRLRRRYMFSEMSRRFGISLDTVNRISSTIVSLRFFNS